MRTAIFALGAQETATRDGIRELIAVSGGQKMLDEIFTEEAIQKQMRTLFQNAPPAQQAKAERFTQEFSKEFTAAARTQREHLPERSSRRWVRKPRSKACRLARNGARNWARV